MSRKKVLKGGDPERGAAWFYAFLREAGLPGRRSHRVMAAMAGRRS